MNRCPVCPREFNPISGSGPAQSQILWLGERPGGRENDWQQVFCGATGEELDETYMLGRAGLQRHAQRVENCVRCWAENNRTPSDKEVDSCARHFLPATLRECQPEVVVLMGGRACRIADRKLRIDTHHGSPYYGSLLGGEWEGWIWPSYHPALGMHDTSKMSQLLEDFEKLGLWLKGKWSPTQDPEMALDYRMIQSSHDLHSYLDCLPAVLEMGTDTENHGPKPYSIQISHTPGTGRMIKAERVDLIEEFANFASQNSTDWIFHYAQHDLDVGEQMGVVFPRYRDTMQEAYHQGSLPQALKPLAFQLLGVEMVSWEDTVWPASIKALQAWMEDAWTLANALLQVEKTTFQKTWLCVSCGHRAHVGKKCKKGCACQISDTTLQRIKRELLPGPMEAILKHVMVHVGKTEGEEKEYDPFKKLPEFWAEGLRGKRPEDGQLEWLEDQLGPVPILGIGNCTQADAVRYAVGDADCTLQVAEELEKRRGDKRWEIMDGDEDQ